MTRKPRIQRKRVKALTDPQPEFVSLVTAGANMTPFKALKSDELPEAEVVADASPAEEVVESDAASFCAEKADTHEIAKIVFAKSAFVDADAVKVWLADGGFADFDDIAEDDDYFSVGQDDGTATKVEWEGITIFINDREVEVVEASSEPNAETSPTAVTDMQPVAKAEDAPVVAEPVVEEVRDVTEVVAEKQDEESESCQRYDDYKAMLSSATTMEKVLADGFDGLPPAIHEVTNAMYVTVRNCALSRDVAGIKAASKAYGNMVSALVSLFPAGVETEAAKTAIENASALEDPVVKSEEVLEVIETQVSADKTPVAEETVEVEASKTEEVAPEVVEDASPNIAALVIKLAESVQELTNNFSNLHNQVAAKADALAERVTAIETERQSRKGADVDEVETETMSARNKKSSSGIADLTLRAALGIQRQPR